MNNKACACGSGLRAARCCEWDAATAASPGVHDLIAPAIDRVVALVEHGKGVEAEALCQRILELSPGDIPCLKILADLVRPTRPQAAEALLKRVVAIDPDDWVATSDVALSLLRRGDIAEAEVHARNALRIAPENALSHNLMGVVLTESNRPQSGEYHYRRALDLSHGRDPSLLANLGLHLKNQGKMEAAHALYTEAADAAPKALQILLGFAKLEETQRNLRAASELLDRCDEIEPGDPHVILQRAVVHGRGGEHDRAIATLDSLADHKSGLGPTELLEKGRLLDRVGRYDEAFAAFEAGKAAASSLSGRTYMAEVAEHQARRLRGFFTRSRVAILPKAGVAPGAQPLFIVGFPRSGTTLTEQMLSFHSAISAGDELPFINEIAAIMPRMLASPMTYPEALAELWMGDRREGLDDLRDHYLRQARRYGVMEEGVPWFTDKMPLNETHLGLIHLVFPRSPIIHVVRHPLDVVLSVFSNQLTHGFYCAHALETAARHYALTFGLIEHYKAQLDLRYLAVKYEDIVDDQRGMIERMLAFVGEPFEERCLHFEENKRYARTASYAQVTEKLYDRSRYRYLRYRRHLEPVVAILRPMIDALGYPLD